MKTTYKNIAVFGGSGFLGRFLINELVKRKYQVINFDIKAPEFPLEEVKFISIDILNREDIAANLANTNFDVVYNLAGFANLDQAVKFPYQTMKLNVLGNLNILDACLQANVSRFVYASSAYALSDKGSIYGISKLTSEKIVEEYGAKHNLSFTILRYGSVYAEENFDNNYIYKLIHNAIITGKIEHHGTGDELREYIHASDAAKLSVDVIEDDLFVNNHVIFTGTEKIKRLELFQMINEILGNKLEIVLQPNAEQNHYRFTPYSYQPTISKKLVANPHLDLGQGIVECIKAVYKSIEE